MSPSRFPRTVPGEPPGTPFRGARPATAVRPARRPVQIGRTSSRHKKPERRQRPTGLCFHLCPVPSRAIPAGTQSAIPGPTGRERFRLYDLQAPPYNQGQPAGRRVNEARNNTRSGTPKNESAADHPRSRPSALAEFSCESGTPYGTSSPTGRTDAGLVQRVDRVAAPASVAVKAERPNSAPARGLQCANNANFFDLDPMAPRPSLQRSVRLQRAPPNIARSDGGTKRPRPACDLHGPPVPRFSICPIEQGPASGATAAAVESTADYTPCRSTQ